LTTGSSGPSKPDSHTDSSLGEETVPAIDSTDRKSDTASTGPLWRRGLAALREGTPLIAIILTAFSAYIAFHSLTEARSVSREQAESSEPILVPGTPLSERGRTIGVATDFAFVRKRADRLYLSRRSGRLVIPLRNGGSGIALTIGLPVVVQTCSDEPRALSETAALGQTLGSYVIPSGESDQLGYVPGKDAHVHGTVTVNGKARWYTFGYQDLGKGTFNIGRLLLWYTDAALRTLRWTCITYQDVPAESRGLTTAWALTAQVFGESTLPPALKLQ
jgi:hypothetical protein